MAKRKKIDSREDWLTEAVDLVRGYYSDRHLFIPKKLRVSIGFTSKGIHTGRRGRIGETWGSDLSTDGTTEIFLRPDLFEVPAVMATLAHELIHAAVPNTGDHGPEFKRHMGTLKMQGRATVCVPGPEFQAELERLVASLGAFPHARLNFEAAKMRQAMARHIQQGTQKPKPQIIKFVCDTCK